MAEQELAALEDGEAGRGFFSRARGWVARRWERLHPSPYGRRGAAVAIATTAALAAAVTGGGLRVGFGLLDAPFGALVGVAVAAVVALVTALAARLLAAVPGFIGALGLAAVAALVVVLIVAGLPPAFAAGIGAALAVVEASLGGALAALTGGRGRTVRPLQRSLRIATAVLAAGVNGFLVWWLAIPGWSSGLTKAPEDHAQVKPIVAPDPSLPGAYHALALTYGSGSDRRRPEFGARAALTTEAVDASPFVKGNEGFKVKARRWFWGFDLKHVPRNGRVWYPDGAGPFPLVLIVHGNHTMEEFSDPGYAYLAEHLASRGFIAVSVDENFLNGSWAGGLSTENDARAWLLLEHLDLFRKWNGSQGNPFFAKVDMGQLALIGHSRGGEAAAVAAAFSRLSRYPDDATVELPSGLAIRSVVAIAPSDGQYSPAGKPTPLANLNYLVLQGAHDGDVSTFMGARQYDRVAFTDGGTWFKASVYAYRANHGQFNTVWGRDDVGWPRRLFLNTRPIMTGDDQRRLARTAITAFLEATLKGRTAYVPFFRDLRRGRPWLPEGIYVSRYADSQFRVVADFEEDVDVTTATLPGATIAGHGLAVWREQNLPLRRGEARQTGVVFLGWRKTPPPEVPGTSGRAPTPASYEITLSDDARGRLGLDARSSLVLSVADANEQPPEPEGTAGEGATRAADKPPVADAPIDFSVELSDRRGVTARLPLSGFRPLVPPLKTRFTKLPGDAKLYGNAAEPVLQTFELPLAAFVAASPRLDPTAVKAIRLVFDRTAQGVIVLDDLSFEVPGTIF